MHIPRPIPCSSPQTDSDSMVVGWPQESDTLKKLLRGFNKTQEPPSRSYCALFTSYNDLFRVHENLVFSINYSFTLKQTDCFFEAHCVRSRGNRSPPHWRTFVDPSHRACWTPVCLLNAPPKVHVMTLNSKLTLPFPCHTDSRTKPTRCEVGRASVPAPGERHR